MLDPCMHAPAGLHGCKVNLVLLKVQKLPMKEGFSVLQNIIAAWSHLLEVHVTAHGSA